ncbi:hypothetical protein Tco_0821747 [Tanacetum coccineum]|uniref:Uncharacterized protein n=1 Tax=Tanacetum coccineum TaxID=301880 RepID=A0ABQ5AE25_9ASTR
MAVLESCPKHNMVAYLENTKGNAEFHEIINFLKRSSIHHALTHSKLCLSMRTSIRSDLLLMMLMGYQLSPRPSPTPIIPDSIPETSGGNLGSHSSSDKSLSGNEGDMTLQSVYDLCLSLCAQVSDQAKEIQQLKAQITKLKKQAKPGTQRVCIPNTGWKFPKGESSVQRDPLFDEIPKDTVDHMETENAYNEGRTRDMVDEDKEINENILIRKGLFQRLIQKTKERRKLKRRWESKSEYDGILLLPPMKLRKMFKQLERDESMARENTRRMGRCKRKKQNSKEKGLLPIKLS